MKKPQKEWERKVETIYIHFEQVGHLPAHKDKNLKDNRV